MFLLDCGEGTQRQMMRFGVGFSVSDVFVSHLHADHYLGITGLLRTMSLQGRGDPLRIWGPPGSSSTLRTVRDLGGDRVPFETSIEEMEPGQSVPGDGFRIEAFATEHSRPSIGFALIEEARPGRFDVEKARELGIPDGPLFGRLHRGESIELEGGRRVTAAELVGPTRSGRKLVYTADTRPSEKTVEVARDADLLVHEATFDSSEAVRARETGHSTAAEAASIAQRANVERLVITHISARYADQPGRLLDEARAVFPKCDLAKDGWSLELPYRDVPESTGAE